ncbi:MAG: NAD(P)/FAD-dependent oxidoreductase [Deltaproteobacteria bacterium]|nr:NAD(P)/FAD-dependent oxidoreductase [Deltaproteobacteria bacterium]
MLDQEGALERSRPAPGADPGPGPTASRPRVLIIGGGFAGLTLAKELGSTETDVLLLDRSNHHLFQPLLYQVATAGLSPADIAIPIRSVVRRHQNVTVRLAEATHVDFDAQRVTLSHGDALDYTYLALCAGAQTSYFGHDDWAEHTLSLKTIDEAVEIRRRVLLAFERAESLPPSPARDRHLTFVVIGGGPTGVEMAGALIELARVVCRDLRTVKAEDARVLLIEAGPRILPAMPAHLSTHATEALRTMGVEPMLGRAVSHIGEGLVELGDTRIATETIIWAAGVSAIELTKKLGVPLDERSGRILVGPDCAIPGHPNAFALGDIAYWAGPDGRPLPGVSPVAMQQARYVARIIRDQVPTTERRPFAYFDKGTMATIGRSRAVAKSGRFEVAGAFAWFLWLFVHIFYLVGFKNRIFVLFSWIWSYVTYRRAARLITGPRLPAPRPRS